jgi:hypothetical protein
MAEGWRSTTLQLVSNHCPAALTFYEQGLVTDRSQFLVGTAAHAILEEIGKASAAAGHFLDIDESEAVADRVCEALTTTGRDFEGTLEPPLPSEAVFRGRDLALAYQIDSPLAPDFAYEEGLAVTREWLPCTFGREAWLRCRLDARGTRLPDWLEDDGGGPMLVIRDYKSAWSAGENQTRTIQRKIQAVLAWDRYGKGHDGLRVEVVNFRLRQSFEIEIYPNTPEGARVLSQWRRDIEMEIRAREQQVLPDGSRPAVPGAGCWGCPYLFRCEAAQNFLGEVYGLDDPETLAIRYAVLEAALDELKVALKEATDEGPIEIPGAVVGTLPKERRTLKKEAPERLAGLWLKKTSRSGPEGAIATLPGLLQALAPGVENAEKLLTHLHKGNSEEIDKRHQILAGLVTTKVARSFGVHRGERG